jgi:amino acid adenylation domain-containing protein
LSGNFNPACAVYRRALAEPGAEALVCAGQRLGYGDLAGRASRLAALLPARAPGQAQPRIGILASRSIGACVGALGAAWSGAAYVPLGLKQPAERLLALIERCGLSAIVTDDAGARLLDARLLQHCPETIVHAGQEAFPQDAGESRIAMPGETNETDETNAPPAAPAFMDADDTAYLLFTSGTTGEPKGVVVPAGALRRYVEAVVEVLGLRADDRVLGISELSFDVSAHNMFATWQAGGALYPLPAAQTFAALKFAREARLTVWNSVPSFAGMLRRLGALAPGCLPDLRLTAFGGEALPAAIVDAWREAAPAAAIFNVYGPTEVTVGCIAQRVDAPPPLTPGRDVVAIGMPFPGTEAGILDEHGRTLPDGVAGELALAGAQLAQGYLDDPALTAQRFRVIDGKRWYLSGDLALRDDAGRLHCLGRIDNQVKVLGHRIELDDIEAHLRSVSGSDAVGAVAWPSLHGAAQGIVAFVAAAAIDARDILAALKERLPAYMLPHRVVALPELPCNASGKIDRRALLSLLEGAQQ